MTFGTAISLATERVIKPIEGMHLAIANQWFRRLGPGAEPVRIVHDSVLSIAYATIRIANVSAGAIVDLTYAAGERQTARAHAVVNGLWGDLGQRGESIEVEMGLRNRQGESVAVGPNLSKYFPEPSGHLVILLHGLFDTERCFDSSDEQPGLMPALETHGELTPLGVRYNSGLTVAENGEKLSALLESIVAEWPVPVQSVSLVGHSMGGLVAYSACLAAINGDHGWLQSLTDLVTLATPHRGSPVEKAVSLAQWGLGFAQPTRPLAEFLNMRSDGIKALRFGHIEPADAHAHHDRVRKIAKASHFLPDEIRQHFVGATASRDPRNPLGRAIGDLMVRPASSTNGANRTPTNVLLIGGSNHLSVLHHPVVIESVLGWLTPAPLASHS